MTDTEYGAIVDTNRDELRDPHREDAAAVLSAPRGGPACPAPRLGLGCSPGRRPCALRRTPLSGGRRGARVPPRGPPPRAGPDQPGRARGGDGADPRPGRPTRSPRAGDGWILRQPCGRLSFEFHCNATVSGIIAQMNWLFELVSHGEDIARAVGAPWEIRERDILLILREVVELAVRTSVPICRRPQTSAWLCRFPARDRMSCTFMTGSRSCVSVGPATDRMPS